MVRCLIVDDEPLAVDVLKRFISNTPGLEVTNSFLKPAEAFAYLQQNKVDLLFIDIQMPGFTGLELIRSLKNPPQVVFTTAYREHAAEGFELQALDYIVKPIAYDRFLKTVDKFHSITRSGNSDSLQSTSDDAFIFIKVDKEMVKLRLKDICYVEALKNYVRIKSTDKEVISYHTLSYMEEKLPSNQFTRIHKSFLVNISKIDKYTLESVEVAGKLLPVGKTYQPQLTTRLESRSI